MASIARRTQAAQRQDRRARIVRAATRLFARYGFEGTSTKAIALEARVPSGLVFYYFPTKEALIEAILDESVPQALQRALDGLDPALPARERLYHFVLMMGRWLETNKEIALIFMSEIGSRRPVAARLRAIRRTGIERLSALLEPCLRKPGAIDAATAAQMVSSAVIFSVVLDQPENRETYSRRLIDIVLPERPRRAEGYVRRKE